MKRQRPRVLTLEVLREQCMGPARPVSSLKAAVAKGLSKAPRAFATRFRAGILPSLLYLSLLLAACAHTPPDASFDRPLPEPKTLQEPTESSPATETSDETAPAEESSEEDQTSEEGQSEDAAETRSLTISLSRQAFAYAEDGAVVRTGPISSGAKGYPTPTGDFSVLSKDKDKVSSRYTNQLGMQAWMPYSLQFHGNYFLHEGWLPGYPDSHGCIRLGEKDARFLFETMKIGDKVIVKK